MSAARDELLWGEDAEAVRAGAQALIGHHPERGGQERDQAVFVVIQAVKPHLPIRVSGVEDQAVERMLAWLLRNERVEPEAIERAVDSAYKMRLGEAVTLTGDSQALRRAFVFEQVGRLKRR